MARLFTYCAGSLVSSLVICHWGGLSRIKLALIQPW